MINFFLSADSLAILKTVNFIIISNTTVKDQIFKFANIPVFSLLSNRFDGIKTVVHWSYFLPDNLAITETKNLVTNLPKVIVYLA